jgi:hypothetical protein
MYPLSDPALYLSDIARHWSREPSSMSETEILDRLLTAFWLGDLVAAVGATPALEPRAEQLKLLRLAARFDDHPGLLFIPEGEDAPDVLIDLPGGGSLADPRTRVVWPPLVANDHVTLTDEAFEQLAHVPLAAYAPDVRPALELLCVERVEFHRFCQQRGYPLPSFWRQKSGRLSPAAAKARCEYWLRALARGGSTPSSKPAMRKTALKQFPGLSERAFDRIWAKDAPLKWRKPGAPKNTELMRADRRGIIASRPDYSAKPKTDSRL